MFLQYSCKLFFLKFLYILKFLKKHLQHIFQLLYNYSHYLHMKLNFCCHFQVRFLFPRDNLCSSILNFNFTIHSHSFSVTHIFKPSLFSAITWMEMKQTTEQFFGTSTPSTSALRYAVNLTTEINVWKALIFVVVCVFWCELYHPDSYCISHIKIGQGWRLFCCENELKEGDIVVFQIDNDFIEPNIKVFVNGCCCD